MSNSKSPNIKKYYVYEWFIKDTGEVFYVGKGCGNRWKTKKRENRFFCLMLENHDCDVRKVYKNLTEEEAYQKEIETIAYYRENTNYRLTNVTDGGDNPPTFYGDESPTKRKEVRLKISEASKRNWSNKKFKLKMQKAMKEFYKTEKGQKLASERSIANWENDETREKIISSMIKTTNSKEYKIRQSRIMKEAYSKEEVREKVKGANNGASRRISQYDLQGNLLNTFETLTEAEKQLGLSIKNITKALRGHRKTAYGYIWKYDDDKNITYKKRKPYAEDVNRERKPIIQYDLNNNFIKEYDSIASAIKENDLLNHSNIIANLKGRTKSAYGFIWEYKN